MFQCECSCTFCCTDTGIIFVSIIGHCNGNCCFVGQHSAYPIVTAINAPIAQISGINAANCDRRSTQVSTIVIYCQSRSTQCWFSHRSSYRISSLRECDFLIDRCILCILNANYCCTFYCIYGCIGNSFQIETTVLAIRYESDSAFLCQPGNLGRNNNLPLGSSIYGNLTFTGMIPVFIGFIGKAGSRNTHFSIGKADTFNRNRTQVLRSLTNNQFLNKVGCIVGTGNCDDYRIHSCIVFIRIRSRYNREGFLCCSIKCRTVCCGGFQSGSFVTKCEPGSSSCFGSFPGCTRRRCHGYVQRVAGSLFTGECQQVTGYRFA